MSCYVCGLKSCKCFIRTQNVPDTLGKTVFSIVYYVHVFVEPIQRPTIWSRIWAHAPDQNCLFLFSFSFFPVILSSMHGFGERVNS
jgi:hypothetical protein